VGKLPTLKPREVVALLESRGFGEVRQKGSQKQFRHSDGRGTTVPFHAGAIFLLRCCARSRRTSASRLSNSWAGPTRLPNKGMKQTSVERIGRSQLIPGVRRTDGGARWVDA
jgi:predicted RNA binding protein YcfA (HicA-like mRNA interferase family)